MKIIPRSLKWRIISGGLIFLAVFLVGGYLGLQILFSGPHPECGRAIDGAFQYYALESGQTNAPYPYPNVNGDSVASLRSIKPYFGDQILRYSYVPGLRYSDSNCLVLMYLKEKTRYTWHADTTHNIFSPKLWKIISPDILYGGPDTEGGELVTTAEFKRRMQDTLAFLKNNQRPNWPAVVAEQTAFLNSIKE